MKNSALFSLVTSFVIAVSATGEQNNFQNGSETRLFEHVRSKGDARDLSTQDAWFTPDGRKTSGWFAPLTLSDGSEVDETLHSGSPKPQPGEAPTEFNVQVSEESARTLRKAIARDPNPEVDSDTRLSAAHDKPARIPLVIPPRKEPLKKTSPIKRFPVPSESGQKIVASKTGNKLEACRAAAAKRITHCDVQITTCGGSLSCEKVRCDTSFTGCDDIWHRGPFEFYCDTGNTWNRDARYENVIAKACPAQ